MALLGSWPRRAALRLESFFLKRLESADSSSSRVAWLIGISATIVAACLILGPLAPFWVEPFGHSEFGRQSFRYARFVRSTLIGRIPIIEATSEPRYTFYDPSDMAGYHVGITYESAADISDLRNEIDAFLDSTGWAMDRETSRNRVFRSPSDVAEVYVTIRVVGDGRAKVSVVKERGF